MTFSKFTSSISCDNFNTASRAHLGCEPDPALAIILHLKVGLMIDAKNFQRNKMKPTNPNADRYVEEQRQYLFHFSHFPANPLVRHPELTHWGDTLVGHPCLTLLRNALVRHSCLTLLFDTLAWHSCKTLLLETLTWHFLLDTLTWHSCSTLLLRHSYLTLL